MRINNYYDFSRVFPSHKLLLKDGVHTHSFLMIVKWILPIYNTYYFKFIITFSPN